MSLDCLPMTHFQISHRATSAQSCIVIDSQRRKNIGKLAHGGNVRNSANTCRLFRFNRTNKITNGPRWLSEAPVRSMFSECQRKTRS